MDLCRVCLENKGTIDIYVSTQGISISSKIMHCCANIHLQNDDGLPTQICSDCERELAFAYQFILKCEITDKKLQILRSKYSKFNNQMFEIKVEAKDETDCDKSLNFELNDNTSIGIIKEENHTLEIPLTSSNVTKPEPFPKPYYKVIDKKKCNVCEKQCTNQSTLIVHMRKHSDERPYACKSCDKKYKDSGGLKRHIARNHDDNRKREVICEICGKAFFSYSAVKTHMRTHTGETPYSCPTCPSKFTQISSLLRHQLRHTGEKAHSCSKCNKAFHTKVELTNHKTAHTSEKKFICTTCNIPFKYANSLRKHILQHSSTINFVCDHCNRAFKTKGNLKIHIHCKHSEKSGICHICLKNVPNLEVHLSRHTGKRSMKCDMCSSTFFDQKTLTRHINFRHIYKDKYKCIVDGCLSGFPSHQMLEYHIAKFHSSSIPFPCDICSKGFYRKNDLTNHKLNSHRDFMKS